MRNFFAIWRRELTSSFLSPVAYVIMVIFLAMTGLIFWDAVVNNVGTDEPLATMLCAAIVVCETILITVICMRLFAEEKRSGTIETLMTAPVTETEVVMGKYAGALSFVVLVTAPSIGFIFILKAVSPGIEFIDIGALAGACAIVLLTMVLCVSVGLLVSLTTRNQVVAAICCFCAIWAVLLFGSMGTVLPGRPAEVFEYMSAMTHIQDFARGSIDTRPVVFYLSGTVLMLFASIRILESRRW